MGCSNWLLAARVATYGLLATSVAFQAALAFYKLREGVPVTVISRSSNRGLRFPSIRQGRN